MRDEATASSSASAASGRSARAVTRAAHADIVHANGPPGWATNAELLDEVDDGEEDDFANFDDEEGALDFADEQRALVALFRTACRDRAV
jgi:hypothetical protein